jgi:hypothetical protein
MSSASRAGSGLKQLEVVDGDARVDAVRATWPLLHGTLMVTSVKLLLLPPPGVSSKTDTRTT